MSIKAKRNDDVKLTSYKTDSEFQQGHWDEFPRIKHGTDGKEITSRYFRRQVCIIILYGYHFYDFFRVKEVDQQSKKLLLDLEWNPRSIYQTIIQREETETGVKSSKNHDASAEECLGNDEVREIMTKNLSTLSRLVEGNC